MTDPAPLGRDEIANMAIRDAREIVGFLDDADEITADGTRAACSCSRLACSRWRSSGTS